MITFNDWETRLALAIRDSEANGFTNLRAAYVALLRQSLAQRGAL